ncbi:hypothetical protein CDD81_7922 [Ophiocordyceps australis]|uniref:Uncharacterized protein n=1 Tax=Ophiocordyceps australis TaxID=1399860 RepID=A0A2C5X8V4_9HYPO|nr:hypothetical protein CDD81_7922 [Ophiocordyceps australis]
MDRPEPGLVKWSANPAVDSFVHLNLQRRILHRYEPTGHARHGKFEYAKLSTHDKIPRLSTYDWSPVSPELVAVANDAGAINLLRIDDNSNAFAEIGPSLHRTCQSVAFNTTGLLAVGFDRVRLEPSLHVWDINRLSRLDEQSLWGFPPDASSLAEQKADLEYSASVRSLKFFEDSPQTLVAGIRGHCVKLIDLRDPEASTTFQTKCNNNLAIDYADQNYFASSDLSHPGVTIWDRRAANRAVASHTYMKAVDDDELPWGGALCLDKVIETGSNPFLDEGKHSLIRSMRYCRDRRGLLAALSPSGQLKMLQTTREMHSSLTALQRGPELLEVRRSHDLDVSYRDLWGRSDRIVSFDWVTLKSPVLQPRVIVLRASGRFDILEEPCRSSQQVFGFVPWQTPHRGLDAGTRYHDLMQFEPSQSAAMLGPFVAEQTLSELALFGAAKAETEERLRSVLKDGLVACVRVEQLDGMEAPLPESLQAATCVAEKLRSLREYVGDQEADARRQGKSVEGWREKHQELLGTLMTAKGLPREAQCIVDHAMLLRAKDKYLLDAAANGEIVGDDGWERYVWDWVADAQSAADEGGMVMGNMDLGLLGVHGVWTNNLGKTPRTRLSAGTSAGDTWQWERAIGQYCKKHRLGKLESVATKKPHHRQLCLEICSWGHVQREEADSQRAAAHTRAAGRALFSGKTQQAIDMLRRASAAHPQLLFVSLALQLAQGAGREQVAAAGEEWAGGDDAYLEAMSWLIATGDWRAIARQQSLPLADRVMVAVRNFDDEELTEWLEEQMALAVAEGDVAGIVLTGMSDGLVDVVARFVDKYGDVQTAALLTAAAYPRYVDDVRCRAWRNAYRALLQRHALFLQRTRFDVESTRRSKRHGLPTLKPPCRQIALRCVFCDAQSLAHHGPSALLLASAVVAKPPTASAPSTATATATATPPLPAAPPHQLQQAAPPPSSSSAAAALEPPNALLAATVAAGVCCPNCGRHLPRCVVCLQVVGLPRPTPDSASCWPDSNARAHLAPEPLDSNAARFPTFCLRCEHVLHLDHARQWFARHVECPVPECRCRCNFRANPELVYR